MKAALDLAREAFASQAWTASYDALTDASGRAPLAAEDLERLAVTCQLLGYDEASDDAWARAHHEYLRRSDLQGAARSAFWLGFGLIDRGEFARGGGWLARAERALDHHDGDCVERGYLLIPAGLQAMEEGDPAGAAATFEDAAVIANRFEDRDLTAMTRLGRGTALIAEGLMGDGVEQLDEAMVAVTAGEVSPVVVGTVYCAVIEACRRIFDLRRAQEWTTALGRWCDAQPDLVPYRGQCQVYRAEIMALRGAWTDALAEAQRACERLSERPGLPATGAAFYQVGELHRLAGRAGKAEAAYKEASRRGRSPYPGMALLRLAQGRIDAAAAGISRVLDETTDPIERARSLPAHVEIALAAGDPVAASAAANELVSIAQELGAPSLQAAAAHGTGAVALAAGDATGAIEALRRAALAWQELDAPYEVARTRALIGSACRVLGDEDGAELELDAARHALELLGAPTDLLQLEDAAHTSGGAGSLTSREVEVLRLVASGMTNRAVAKHLVISEKTVARHLSNIFAKLGVASRTGATAYAYEHGLA